MTSRLDHCIAALGSVGARHAEAKGKHKAIGADSTRDELDDATEALQGAIMDAISEAVRVMGNMQPGRLISVLKMMREDA
jgi:hypothetical protein